MVRDMTLNSDLRADWVAAHDGRPPAYLRRSARPAVLSLDYETFSTVDLKKCGLSRYARDISTEVLMCAYAFDDGPVAQWVPDDTYEQPPAELSDALEDDRITKRAWNAAFEQNITEHVLGIPTPFEAWRCTMVLALTLSLPAALDRAGAVVGLPPEKAKLAEGKRLIKTFCVPRTPTKTKLHTRSTRVTDPEKWELFCAYNRQDVEAERATFRRLRHWDLPPDEWRNWFMDRAINERGLPINRAAVDGALRIAGAVIDARTAELKAITGLDNPNSGAQLLPWLNARGYPYADLKKGHVARALDEKTYSTDEAGKVLALRREIAKASIKKYAALERATDDDGYLRHHYQFVGAGRTWRTAGRIYQPTNLPRPMPVFEKREIQADIVDDMETTSPAAFEWLYGDPLGALSTALRPVVEAPAGYVLVGADLNAIENRGAGWLSGDRKILDVFRKGRCPYIDFATYMYGGTYDELFTEYKAGNKKKRTNAKPATLGCQYGLGAGEEVEDERTGEIIGTGLLGYAWSMGIKISKEESKHSVDTWRSTFTECMHYWNTLDKAFRHTIQTGQPAQARSVRFDRSGPFVRALLPSGRAIYYCRPQILDRKTPWGEVRPTITYEGMNTQKQWVRISTHGGKLLENMCQSLCRDLMYYGARLATARGIDIRLTVYDEVVALAREDEAERTLKALTECMTTPPPWAPDFPLGAAGSYFRHFVKD
jgi:DNA polymerase